MATNEKTRGVLICGWVLFAETMKFNPNITCFRGDNILGCYIVQRK